MEEVLQDKGKANELYLLIKFEVERNIAYLLEKRKGDPYRNIIDRTIYPLHEVPAFQYVPLKIVKTKNSFVLNKNNELLQTIYVHDNYNV